MIDEEVPQELYVRNIGPPLYRCRFSIKVIYLRSIQGQEERGVGRYDELTLIEPSHALDELRKVDLILRKQGVLRLDKNVQASRNNIVREVLDRRLAV